MTCCCSKAGVFFLLVSCSIFGRTFDVTDYGALGNASFDNTTAIQNAANSACAPPPLGSPITVARPSFWRLYAIASPPENVSGPINTQIGLCFA